MIEVYLITLGAQCVDHMALIGVELPIGFAGLHFEIDTQLIARKPHGGGDFAEIVGMQLDLKRIDDLAGACSARSIGESGTRLHRTRPLPVSRKGAGDKRRVGIGCKTEIAAGIEHRDSLRITASRCLDVDLCRVVAAFADRHVERPAASVGAHEAGRSVPWWYRRQCPWVSGWYPWRLLTCPSAPHSRVSARS